MFLAGRNVLASAAVVLGLVGAAHSQDAFPSKPITIVMPLPAGTSPDLRTRLIAEHWSKTLGQVVVVQNTPGAGGVPGVKSVLGATPDGYTLLAAPSSIFTILPVQNKELGFDVSRDLTPVGQIAGEPMIIAVSSKSSVKDLAGLISEAKARPNALVIGTNPEGTLPFLAGKLLANRSGAPIEV
jgi:tripartite-type tricarboxylate transporter receptor subunit TctC